MIILWQLHTIMHKNKCYDSSPVQSSDQQSSDQYHQSFSDQQHPCICCCRTVGGTQYNTIVQASAGTWTEMPTVLHSHKTIENSFSDWSSRNRVTQSHSNCLSCQSNIIHLFLSTPVWQLKVCAVLFQAFWYLLCEYQPPHRHPVFTLEINDNIESIILSLI